MTELSEAATRKPKRRWFQFSLRSLFVFTSIVAVAIGLVGTKVVRKRIVQSAVDALRKKGAFISYDYYIGQNATPPGPGWVRRLLGDNYFSEVEGVNLSGPRFTDDGLANVREFAHIRFLNLSGTKITDAGLANLRGLRHLNSIHLDGAKLSGEGLADLADLRELRELFLVQTTLTNYSGLENLKPLRQLYSLWLYGTKMSDAGLVHLRGLAQLRYLSLAFTNVTDKGIAELQSALPNCHIEH